MELIIVDDPTKPVLPAVVVTFLENLIGEGIAHFNYVYVPRFKGARIEIHNSFGADLTTVNGRVINDGTLIAAIEAWVPSVYTPPEEPPEL